MSFVTTNPESLTAAATALQNLGTSMAAQNAAAASPTTNLLPAAADPVSALQATLFGAYGTWYQHVSAQAAAVHQMLVNTLGSNAGSYGQTEAANQATTGSTSLSGVLGGATSAAASPAPAGGGSSSSFGATIGTPFEYFQNVGAAASDFIALGQGQFVPSSAGASSAIGLADAGSAGLPVAGPAAVAPAGAAGFGGTPVLAGVGQASSLGGMSVPPSWAAGSVPATGSASTTLPNASWAGAAPQTPQLTTVPGGIPSVASTGRKGLGIGAPHYGVKPTVMPKATVV
jgi:hypothetical protein